MMKRAKFLSKIGAILLLSGSIIFFIAFAAAGFRIGNLNGIKAFAKTDELEAAESIAITLNTTDVDIIFDDSADKISIKYEEMKDSNGETLLKFNVSRKNGKITVSEWESWKSEIYIFDFNSPKITLTIPSSLGVALNVTTDTGDISLLGNASLKESSFTTDTGDVVTASATIKSTETLSFLTDTGDFFLGKVDTGALVIETDTGDVELKKQIKANSVSIKSDTGDIEAYADIIADKLNIRLDNGEFDSSAIIDAMEINVLLDNADVDATFIGEKSDYTIMVSIDNGDSNVKNGGNGARRLNVKSNNGDIEIKFRSR